MKFIKILIFLLVFLVSAPTCFAASNTNSEVMAISSRVLSTLTILSTLIATIFLIKGGFEYMSSTGNPEKIESAKKTIRNAVIGLVIVLSATLISSVLSNSFSAPTQKAVENQIQIETIKPVMVKSGVTQVIIDATTGFAQNLIESALKPLTSAVISFLTLTPSLVNNSAIFNFWLVIVGITNALFAVVIAILGLHVMSAGSLGFEETDLKALLPRIGLAFILANTSLFIAEFIINFCNSLTKVVINSTGGVEQAFAIFNSSSSALITNSMPLITLILMLIFEILIIVLLIFFITRLITISIGAVLSPLIFLLWLIPRFSDFAEISIKTYITMIFTIFVQVIIIQLSFAFLGNINQTNQITLLSILIGIGILVTLLKTPGIMMNLVIYNSGKSFVKKMSNQMVNVMSSEKSPRSTNTYSLQSNTNRKELV